MAARRGACRIWKQKVLIAVASTIGLRRNSLQHMRWFGLKTRDGIDEQYVLQAAEVWTKSQVLEG
jgi:hypothetical protein